MKCKFCNKEAVHWHHCFWRSEYFGEDRDEDWNLIPICFEHHFLIHHTDKGKHLDKFCKILAFNQYKGLYKEKLKAIIKRKKYV